MMENRISIELLAALIAKLTAGDFSKTMELNNQLNHLPKNMIDEILKLVIQHGSDTELLSLIETNFQNSPESPAFDDEINVSPLPDYVGFKKNNIEDIGTWLDEYINFTNSVSPMTPASFHLSAALFVASVVIARRLFVEMPFARVYPNIFVLWLAPTTLFRKSTTLDLSRNFLTQFFPFLLSSQESTPEALMSDLSGAEPVNLAQMTNEDAEIWKAGRNFAAQRGMFVDEFSLLMDAMSRNYNLGLLEMLMQLHDCINYYSRSSRTLGIRTIRSSYLSILAASTPGAMHSFLRNERLWTGGFFPRFALLTPEQDRPEWKEAKTNEIPSMLINRLGHLYKRLPIPVWPKPPEAIQIRLDTEAFDLWSVYYRAVSGDLLKPPLNNILHGTYGRLPTQVIKIAIILSALEWDKGDAPHIGVNHIAYAIEISETWRYSAHRVLAFASISGYERMKQRILEIILSDLRKKATFRDLCRGMRGNSPDVIMKTLGQMILAGDIVDESVQPGPQGGRPTTAYRIRQ